MWQDYAFAAGSVSFVLALLPTLTDPRARVPRFTSLLTAFWLGVFAVAQWTLGMRLAPVCEVVCAACWLSLALRGLPARGPDPFGPGFGPELRRVQREHSWLSHRRPE